MVDEEEVGSDEYVEMDKEYSLEYNIQQVTKEGDLSPRYMESLNTKKDKILIQVQTRSSKGGGGQQ